jgi:type I restriction enzyme R subunit
MNAHLTEQQLEDIALEWLEGAGWRHVFGPDIAPETQSEERKDFSTVFLAGRLHAALRRLNPEASSEVLDEAFRIVTRPDSPDLLTNNRAFHKMLTEYVPVPFRDAEGRDDTAQIRLIEWNGNQLEANDWLAVNQFTVIEPKYVTGSQEVDRKDNRRPDIVLFVNGLPLTLFELKNATNEQATVQSAFRQVQTYKAQIESLFTYNELVVLSDGLDARIGTISSDWERFMPWRAWQDNLEERQKELVQLQTMIQEVFDRPRFLQLLRHFLVFEDTKDGPIKKLAGYHQFHAVNVALNATIEASREGSNGRAGVVWHTQGSGKSLTMVYFAGRAILAPELANPTLVVVTDRNDLDEQLFDTFAACKELLHQTPVRAESRAEIRELLRVNSGGVVFTTIQKFYPDVSEEAFPALTDRRNVIVLADEAHRSQYGLEMQLVTSGDRKGQLVEGYAMHMRHALPNASFLAFTGTPIALKDANTTQVFGDLISVYDVQRAVEDKATVPIYYEGRFAKIELNEEMRPKIDPEFEEVTEGEEEPAKERLKRQWAAREALVGDEKRLRQVVADLLQHWEKREEAMPGKAMIVCMSRRIAVAMYKEIIRLKPEWHSPDNTSGVLKVVMTGAASDPEEYMQHIRSKGAMEALAKRFKNSEDPFKLVIVRDMWLTGFDAPCMTTMYLDKPMYGHNLMQAIARVNRVFKEKQGGLVVDYLGLGEPLKEALAEYTQITGDEKEKAAEQIEKAVRAFFEQLDVCRGVMHGFDYSDWREGTPQDRLEVLADGLNFALGFDTDKQQRLDKNVANLSAAFALCVPNERVMEHRIELAFFQALKAALAKEKAVPKPNTKPKQDYDLAVRQLVTRSILPGGVVDLFAAAGLEKPNIALLSNEFLEDLKHMPRRNLALELLKRILDEEIRLKSERNVVKGRTFAEMLEEAVRRYTSNSIEMAQLVDELVEMAKELRDERNKGAALGMTADEEAFYDALSTNNSAIEIMGDEQLRFIARELLTVVRNNVTIDWQVRESVRANLRRLVKRVLRRHGYPPDMEERAVSYVIEQAEVICRDV